MNRNTSGRGLILFTIVGVLLALFTIDAGSLWSQGAPPMVQRTKKVSDSSYCWLTASGDTIVVIMKTGNQAYLMTADGDTLNVGDSGLVELDSGLVLHNLYKGVTTEADSAYITKAYADLVAGGLDSAEVMTLIRDTTYIDSALTAAVARDSIPLNDSIAATRADIRDTVVAVGGGVWTKDGNYTLLIEGDDTTIVYYRDTINDTTIMYVPTGVLVIQGGSEGLISFDSLGITDSSGYFRFGSFTISGHELDSVLNQLGRFASGGGTDSAVVGQIVRDTGAILYQPLEATLTDIADGTIAENLVNTANPWADNEVSDDITITNNILVTNLDDSLGNYTPSGTIAATYETITNVGAIGDDTTNFKTAYGWGDHSAQNYLDNDDANIDTSHYRIAYDSSQHDFLRSSESAVDVDTTGTDIAAALADRANAHDTLTKSFTVSLIDSTFDFPFWMTPKAVTIIAANGVCIGGTNVIGCLMEYDGDAANPAVCNSSDWTFTTGEERTTDLSNPSIDAGDYLGWKTTSVSGTVTFFTLTIEYTVD